MIWPRLLRAVLPQRAVVYDDSFFREQWFHSWDALQHVLGRLIMSEPRWRRVLDFGCGPGIMIDAMRERGLSYVGCDYAEEARALYLARFGAHPEAYVASLSAVDPADFDLFLSFDVFEHMTDVQIDAVLETVRPIPDLLLNISRDWRTPGHINLKSDRAWLRLFRRHGLRLQDDTTRRLRDLYVDLRPGRPDAWDRNLFVLTRPARTGGAGRSAP